MLSDVAACRIGMAECNERAGGKNVGIFVLLFVCCQVWDDMDALAIEIRRAGHSFRSFWWGSDSVSEQKKKNKRFHGGPVLMDLPSPCFSWT